MAAYFKFTISLLLLLGFVSLRSRADSGINEQIFTAENPDLGINELEQLKSKIAVIETDIEAKIRELRSKEESILQLEKVNQEKSHTILSLQKETESLQKKWTIDAEEQVGKAHARAGELDKQVEILKNKIELQNRDRDALELRANEAENKMKELKAKLENTKGTIDAEEQVGKAHARAGELEKQVEILKNKIELQNRDRNALELRANEAEKKMKELNAKLENLRKVSEGQKKQARKAERALQVAEEKLMEAQLEASTWAKKLMEVHGAWLPPWLATHLVQFQSFAAANWNKHGKPTFDVAKQKAAEKSAQAQKWMEPHVETVKSRWIPIVKEHWLTFTATVGPYIQLASARTVEVYKVSKSTVTPHVVKVQKMADPYLQEAKKFTKPYINQAAAVTKPHVDRIRVAVKPYTKHVLYVYGKFLKSATVYHHQVQASVHKTLSKHELTSALATKELVWFLASSVLALPIFFLYGLYSACFRKKARKLSRNGQTNLAHRRPKRRHSDK